MIRMRQPGVRKTATLIAQRCPHTSGDGLYVDSCCTAMMWRFLWRMRISCGSGYSIANEE